MKEQRLQEILPTCPSPGWHCTFVVRYGTEYCELRLKILSDIHNRSNVSTSVTVIWSRPDCYDILVLEVILYNSRVRTGIAKRVISQAYLVTFIDELMCSCYKLKAVDVVEL